MSWQLYFGERVNFAWCHEMELTDVPVGRDCMWCSEPIAPEDSGVMTPVGRSVGGELVMTTEPCHVECWVRTMTGSAAHLGGRCSCFVPGASEHDDPDLTKRQAALVAYEMVLLNREVS
jgi:hypothetical protein